MGWGVVVCPTIRRLVIVLDRVEIRRTHIFKKRCTVDVHVHIFKRKSIESRVDLTGPKPNEERLDWMVECRNIKCIVSTGLGHIVCDGIEWKLDSLCLCNDKVHRAFHESLPLFCIEKDVISIHMCSFFSLWNVCSIRFIEINSYLNLMIL